MINYGGDEEQTSVHAIDDQPTDRPKWADNGYMPGSKSPLQGRVFEEDVECAKSADNGCIPDSMSRPLEIYENCMMTPAEILSAAKEW